MQVAGQIEFFDEGGDINFRTLTAEAEVLGTMQVFLDSGLPEGIRLLKAAQHAKPADDVKGLRRNS